MDSMVIILIAVLAVAVVSVVIILFMKKQLREEMRLGQEEWLKIARQQFENEQQKSKSELELRKQSIDDTVKGLHKELERYQQLVRDFEKDRDLKYGNLQNELKNASQATSKLQETTNQLNNILGNVKLRGQWGERMAEDIIQYAGLIEGVNYDKQKQQSTVTTKPDYTFYLPDEHKIHMDVKFPLDNYLQMVNSESAQDKDFYLKEFSKNVKERIKEIQDKEYINSAENTLDFVLLFIPNEQVFAFVQEKIPELTDLALRQKVVLCSPFTLYAMLSIIRQAHQNFRFEKDVKKIVLLIEQFAKVYEGFKTRFEGMGTALQKVNDQYSDITEKNFKTLDTKIRQIDDYKKGHLPETAKADPRVIELTNNES